MNYSTDFEILIVSKHKIVIEKVRNEFRDNFMWLEHQKVLYFSHIPETRANVSYKFNDNLKQIYLQPVTVFSSHTIAISTENKRKRRKFYFICLKPRKYVSTRMEWIGVGKWNKHKRQSKQKLFHIEKLSLLRINSKQTRLQHF